MNGQDTDPQRKSEEKGDSLKGDFVLNAPITPSEIHKTPEPVQKSENTINIDGVKRPSSDGAPVEKPIETPSPPPSPTLSKETSKPVARRAPPGPSPAPLKKEDKDDVGALVEKARQEAKATSERAAKIILNVPQNNLGNIPVATTSQKENPAMPLSKEEEEVKRGMKTLRTYQGDVAEVISGKNQSVLSVAMAEEKRREKKQPPKKDAPGKTRRINVWLALGSAALFVLGAGLVGGFYYLNLSRAPLPMASQTDALVNVDLEREVSFGGLTKNSLIDLVGSFREDAEAGPGALTYVRVVKRDDRSPEEPITSTEALSLLRANAPGPLVRALGEEFMLGLYKGRGVGAKNEAFLLFSVTSFENAFDGMLRWEGRMLSDLDGLLVEALNTGSAGGLIATSSQSVPLSGNFVDITLVNKDVRLLRNGRNETLLLYVFIRPDLLLIAPSETVFREILNRVFSDETLR